MAYDILRLFFPLRSLTGSPGSLLTDMERKALKLYPILLDRQRVRNRGALSLNTLAAAGSYAASPLLRLAIQRFKYNRIKSLGHEFGLPLFDALTLLEVDCDTALCPVPLHWSRRFLRGFNQSDLLARDLALLTGLKVEHLLKRKSATGKQSLRSHDERRRALKNVFTACGSTFPRHVILIDDVATTLSTLDACARELRSAGAAQVDALVIALG